MTSNPLDDLPSLSAVVKAYNLAANKRLGQHFLLDMNITRNIATLAAPLEDISVIEVGPGPGGLTRALLMAGAKKVVAIEMDDRFLTPLADITTQAQERLQVVHGDALKIDPLDHLSGPIKIAANLPYNVGTKLLTNWLTATPLFWQQAVLMFQKEVAERVVATPDDKAYGRLAILTQSVCHARIAFDVPARAFTPPPKVDSAVIVLDPLEETARFPHLNTLSRVTEAAFGQRRKMLRGSLKSLAKQHSLDVEDWLQSCDIDPQRRAETLSVIEFQALAMKLLMT